MSRFPAYPRRPHSSGQARIKIQGKHVYLGRHGSQESRQKYAELARRHADGLPIAPVRGGPTVGDVVAAFLAVAESEKSRKELAHYQRALTVVSRVAGSNSPAHAFGVAALERVRTAMISGSVWTDEEKTVGRHGPWSRGVVNLAMVRLRHVWRWAESNGLVPPGAWQHLRAMRPIPKTNRAVRQTKPREGVEAPALEAILPHLPAMVQAMAELQWWTGLRPSEAVRVRASDIVEVDGARAYRIRASKNSWRDVADDEGELCLLGPEAWRVLEPWLLAAKMRGDDAPLFPTGRPSESRHYTPEAYARAIRRAFDQHPELKPWTPYQLRHGFKRRIKRSHGLDAARAAMRQRSIMTTDKYDRATDLDLAAKVARDAG